MKSYKGGLSEEVVKTYEFQKYIKSGVVCGYIGSLSRNRKRDEIVERELRAVGLKASGVAFWMTSGSGRHLMDDVSEDLEEFTKRVKSYVQRAFEDVTIWSHPDHGGMMNSSIRLGNMIKEKFCVGKELSKVDYTDQVAKLLSNMIGRECYFDKDDKSTYLEVSGDRIQGWQIDLAENLVDCGWRKV